MKYHHLFFVLSLFLFTCADHHEKKTDDTNPFYDRAFDYREKGVADSSLLYFIKAKDKFILQNDSFGAGKCMVNMAILLENKGDFLGSQELSLNALSYFDRDNKDHHIFLCSNYNSLGIVTQQLGDVDAAVDFYRSAIQLSDDTLNTRVYLNNIGTTYQQAGNYKAAIGIYKRIIKEASKDRKEYARALTNLNYNLWLNDRRFNPLPGLFTALKIRSEEGEVRGINSSYVKLSSYYHSTAQLDTALLYARLSYKSATAINNPDDRLLALEKIIDLSPEAEAKRNFKIYHQLNDSLQQARSRARNQFALIRYQTEKHKSDLLKARTDNVKKGNDILIKNLVLGMLLLVLLCAYLWYRKRRVLMKQEQELEVKNTELKYVKKIHDKVANKVYMVMSEVENNADMDRELLLDKLELLYNVSRDISYDIPVQTTEVEFATELSAMIKSYASSFTSVFIIGNESDAWLGVNAPVRSELYLVMQELMTNMRKHSKAQSVIVRFQVADRSLIISYNDDGIGLKNFTKNNGLNSMESRLQSIGASVSFDNVPEKGLTIQITVPVN